MPTWGDVLASEYVPWDEARDGPRYVIDMSDAALGTAAALAVIGRRSDADER